MVPETPPLIVNVIIPLAAIREEKPPLNSYAIVINAGEVSRTIDPEIRIALPLIGRGVVMRMDEKTSILAYDHIECTPESSHGVVSDCRKGLSPAMSCPPSPQSSLPGE